MTALILYLIGTLTMYALVEDSPELSLHVKIIGVLLWPGVVLGGAVLYWGYKLIGKTPPWER